MAADELLNLAQLQQDTVRALTTLTQPLNSAPALSTPTRQVAQSATLAQGPEASQTASAAAPTAPSGGATALTSALNDATAAVSQLAQNTLAQIQQLQNLNQSMSNLPSLLGELAGGAGSGGGLLGGILGGGLLSLGTAIAGLFTGGPSTPAPLPVYKPPPSLSVDVANSPGFPAAVQDQNGGARAAPTVQGPSTQVTVNISAMDSQSFLDRSSDIARAVREAMLHMDPMNDLINEL